MNLGLDLAFLIPIDFWDYMRYAALFAVLATISAVLSLIDYKETSVIQILLSVVGSVGMIYSLFKAWFVVPSDGSLQYLVLAGFVAVLAVLAGLNFLLNAECKIEGTSSNGCFISLFGLAIFVIMALISVSKAWFVIPPDGYMDYLRFASIWGIFAFLCAVGLASLKLTHNSFKGDWLIFVGIDFFFLMETIYSLQKTWDAMPDSLKLGIMVAIGIIFVLFTGGAVGAGTSGHQSE